VVSVSGKVAVFIEEEERFAELRLGRTRRREERGERREKREILPPQCSELECKGRVSLPARS
jgi:hypothetical protein